LPEVGGDAAYYFDPYNVEDMANTILEALEGGSGDKVKLGFERIKDFSWEDFTKIHLKTYLETK